MSVIGGIQQEIADQIAANPDLAHVTVICEQAGDILDQMAKSLGPETSVGGKVGGFIAVLTPSADAEWRDVGGPFFNKISITVQVTVDVPLAADANIGIGLTALDLCEKICISLTQFFPLTANSPVVPKTPTIKLINRNEQMVTYACLFETMGAVNAPLPQLETVTFSTVPNGGSAKTVTLITTTGGAAVFYTTDGSNPSPRNGTRYTAPVSINNGTLLKAKSFLAGYYHSNIASLTV